MQTLIKTPQPGETFGTAILLEAKVKPSGDMYGLFLLSENKTTPFCSWFIGNNGKCNVTRKFDGKGFCYGYYHKDLTEAMEDFKKR
jgi:hypothetical protein